MNAIIPIIILMKGVSKLGKDGSKPDMAKLRQSACKRLSMRYPDQKSRRTTFVVLLLFHKMERKRRSTATEFFAAAAAKVGKSMVA